MSLFMLVATLAVTQTSEVAPTSNHVVQYTLSTHDLGEFEQARAARPALDLAAWVEAQNAESPAATALEVGLAATAAFMFVSAGNASGYDVLGHLLLGTFVGGVVLPVVGVVDWLDIGKVELVPIVPR